MGHRRSHARVANKRGTSETLLPDPERDRKINEGGSEVYSKSRREKTDYKRKREHKEDASRNRPKERHKGKDHHRHSSKSSAKQKTKERVSRWKNHRSSDSVSSESNSSTSFTSTEGIGHHHCSHSCSDDRSREHSKKRYKADNETLGKDYRTGNYEGLHDATHEPPELDKNELQRQESTTKSRGESSLQRKDTSVGAIGSEVKGLHSASTRKHGHSATVSRTIEQNKGLGEKKEGLEVELRQKALANFMRHQDTSCKMVEHKELSNSALFFRDATNKQYVTDMVIAGQNQGAVAEVDGGWTARLSVLSDAVSLDAAIDEHRWPLASDTLLPIQYKISLEGSPMACHFNSGMGEGQISSDIVQPFTENNKGSENSNPVVEEDEVAYERENSEIGHLHASIDASKKGHKSTSSSTLPEGVIMVTDTQAEIAGSIPRDVIRHSESINVQHELPSKSDQELKRINGTAEHHELEGLQTDDPVTKGRIVVEMDKVCAQKASTATTSVHGKSELSLEHEGKNSECVSKPELATDAQDISTAFQQKTMSVMRGGELVQVNYKVYIPKRAAELARRRLQR